MKTKKGETAKRKSKDLDLIKSMSMLIKIGQNSELEEEFFEEARPYLDYAKSILGLTDMQTIVVALLANNGSAMSWSDMANFFDCPRLTLMTWSAEIDELVKKGWLMRYASTQSFQKCQGFKLVYGVVTAIRHNKAFVPECLEGLTLQQLVDRLAQFIQTNFNDSNIELDDCLEWFENLVELNPNLEFCREVSNIKHKYDRAFLMLLVADYALWAGSSSEGITFKTIAENFPPDYKANNIRRNLRVGQHRFFLDKIIEPGCNDGIEDGERFLLTREVKEGMLGEFKPTELNRPAPRTTDRLLFSHKLISEKTLFYNADEGSQIETLCNLLKTENFEGVQRRLEEKGMRKGFACIFYGAPGTGKTETVLQLARMTGRDIMRVEVAGLRDKWVGESEKNIKSIFSRYKLLCNNCEKQPILLFNEADAIFGRRFESPKRSVEKMDNAMQNIILQEMEDLEGILIATTNLTSSLDSAFERRFLFKLEFKRPNVDARANIWSAMLNDELRSQDIRLLAEKFDLSGGEIENIMRKQAIDYILTGNKPTLDEYMKLCSREQISLRTQTRIGF